MQLFNIAFQLNGVNDLHAQIRTEADGLGAHFFHELWAHDALLEAGVVFYLGGIHKLAAVLEALEDNRVELGACRVQRGGVTGRAGTYDGNIVDGHC